MKSPILFIVFNRPETTRRVFESIRSWRPSKLYIAADGPRSHKSGEAERCAEVRRIATAVDWPCEICTLFRDQNVGCRKGVSSAINWFFECESAGIILEDDVLPAATFFDFCEELLDRYRDDTRIGMISGCNFVSSDYGPSESILFSRYNQIWGWASWRRAWAHYDVTMADWPEWRRGGELAKLSGGSRVYEAYWRRKFDFVYEGAIDTWDYQWTFTCLRLGALTAVPAVNQVTNLGFAADATHTVGKTPQFIIDSPIRLLKFPLSYPTTIIRDEIADALIEKKVLRINLKTVLIQEILALPLVLRFALFMRDVLRGVKR